MTKSVRSITVQSPKTMKRNDWTVKVRFYDGTEELHHVGTKSEADHLLSVFQRDLGLSQ